MIKNKIEINLLRDMYAKALYRAVKDTKAYKYLLFNQASGLQNSGCDVEADDVQWWMLTKKVREMIDMWIRLSQAKKSSTQIQLGDDDMQKVSEYSIPTGNISVLINFSGKIALSESLAESGLCLSVTEYYFNKEEAPKLKEKIGKAFAKLNNVVDDISKYSEKLMEPISAERLSNAYTTINSFIPFDVEKVAKKHATLSDFSGFKEGKFIYCIDGLSNPTFGEEAISILNIANPFSTELSDLTEDMKVITNERAVEWLSQSFKNNK